VVKLSRELWLLLRPHKRSLLLLGLLVAVQAGLNVGGAAALKELMDRFEPSDSAIYFAVPLAVAGVLVSVSFVNYAVSVLAQSTGERIVGEVREDTYEKILQLPQGFFDRSHSASLSSRLIADINWIRTAIRHLYREGFVEPVVILSLAGYLAYLEADLFGIAVAVLPFFFLPVWALGRRVGTVTSQLMDYMAARAVAQQETLAAAPIVKTSGTSEPFAERYAARNRRVVETWIRSYRLSGLLRPLGMTLAGLAFAGVALLGYEKLQAEEVTPGEYAAFLGGLVLFYRAVARLGHQLGSFLQTLGALAQVFEMRDETFGLRFSHGARRPKAPDAHPALIEAPRGEPLRAEPLKPAEIAGPILRLEDVSFAYDEGGELILSHIDLEVSFGEVVAVLGPSGSGKSTLLKLGLGLYAPDSGEVSLAGADPTELTPTERASLLGYLDQEATSFDDTIRFNVTLGRELSDQQIWQALETAGLASFVRDHGGGLDTPIGESGHRLSAGQRRRLAFARAVAARPPLLILDEPTTSLDPDSARHITEALIDLASKDHAVLLVTHLSETAARAHRSFKLHGADLTGGR
jgi:ABC-type multidrug transport system fused ATPase/permease subunit